MIPKNHIQVQHLRHHVGLFNRSLGHYRFWDPRLVKSWNYLILEFHVSLLKFCFFSAGGFDIFVDDGHQKWDMLWDPGSRKSWFFIRCNAFMVKNHLSFFHWTSVLYFPPLHCLHGGCGFIRKISCCLFTTCLQYKMPLLHFNSCLFLK